MGSSARNNTPNSAETWLARLHSPACTAADREAYAKWRREHPEAARACRQVERIHALSASLSRDPALAALARSARRDGRYRRRRRPFAWAAAAMVVVALTLGGLWWHGLPGTGISRQYATSVGEQRTVRLPDGSTALLDTDSALSVRYDAARREVVLVRGRAQFQVASDSRRPFRVRAHGGVIRDIGTRFQVRMGESDTTVTLLEGEVKVSLATSHRTDTLAPGEQVSYAAGRFAPVRTVDLAVARGWTHGELVFRDATLADVVARMNRYSTRKLRLGDAAVGRLRVSGVFHAGNQRALVQALRQGWGIHAEHRAGDAIVLKSSDPPRTE